MKSALRTAVILVAVLVLAATVALPAEKAESFEEFRRQVRTIIEFGSTSGLAEYAQANREYSERLAEEYWAMAPDDPRREGDWVYGPTMFYMAYEPEDADEYISYFVKFLEEGNPDKMREFVADNRNFSLATMDIMKQIIEESPGEKENYQYLIDGINGILEEAAKQKEAEEAAKDPAIKCRDQLFFAQNAYNENLYEQAVKLYGQSRDCYLAALGEESEFMVRALAGEGFSLRAMRRNDEAMKKFNQALELARRIMGEDDRFIGTLLNNIGMLYHSDGNLDKALEYYNKALEFRERTLGKRHPDVAYSYSNVGDVYLAKSNYEAAMKNYRRAMRINMARYGTEHPELAKNYMDMGYLLALEGNYRDALEMHQKALAICINAYGERHVTTAKAYHNLGLDWADIGDREKALENYGKALDIRIRSLGKDNASVAESYMSIGSTYRWAGDYEPALENYMKALDIRLKVFGENSPAVAYIYDTIGLTYMYIGDSENANDYAGKALEICLEIFGLDHPLVARAYSTIGKIFQRFESNESALEYYNKELAILEHSVGENHEDTAFALNRIGITLFYMGRYDEALEKLERSRKIRASLFGAGDDSLAQSYMNIGLVQSYTGDYNDSIENYKKATVVLCRAPEAYDPADCIPETMSVKALKGLAEVYLASGKMREAGDTYFLAAQVLELMREGLISESAKKQHGESFYDMFPRGIGVFATLADGFKGGLPEYERAFEFAEKGIARVFMEMVGQSLSLVHGGIPEEVLEQGEELDAKMRKARAMIDEEENKPEDEQNEYTRRNLYDAYDKVKAEKARYERMLENDYPEYAELKKPRTRSLDEIRGAVLADGEAALEYYVGDNETYLFFITKDDITIEWLPEAAEINKLVDLLRTKLSSPNIPEDSVKSTANKLYEMLLGPVKEKIAGVEKLLIVPTGKLYFLPFEALADGEGKYLAEKYEVRYAPSLNVLYLVTGRNIKRGDIWNQYRQWVGFGDPVYEEADTRSGGGGMSDQTQRMMTAYTRALSEGMEDEDAERGLGWRRIPGTGEEVKEIAGLFGGGDGVGLFLGREASEDEFKKEVAGGVRFLHVASHGTLGEGGARQPALVLSLVGNSDTGEDGFLTMSEVINMKTKAEMVVLSACKTGQGAMEKGEGVAGMARAFLFSGADSLVVSLWSVADKQTRDFMVSFYRKLLEGSGREAALAQTRREMIAAGMHPYFWAPFIFIGVD